MDAEQNAEESVRILAVPDPDPFVYVMRFVTCFRTELALENCRACCSTAHCYLS